MKKALKVFVYVLLAIVVAGITFYLWIYFGTQDRFNRVHKIDIQVFDPLTDSASISHGKRLSIIKGCQDCHGQQLTGKVVINDPPVGVIVGPNLTKGKGGIPRDFSTTDYIRALKHGIDRDGKSLWLMPSYETAELTEYDMACLIGYLQTLMPIDNDTLPEMHIGVVGRILTHFNKMPMIPAERIDHSKPLVKSIPNEEGVAFGKYLAVACEGCHRTNFKGGDPIAPGLPPVPDITSTGHPGKWDITQFTEVLRTGKTPEGKTMKAEHMPWPMTSAYTDVEIRSLYAFFKTLK